LVVDFDGFGKVFDINIMSNKYPPYSIKKSMKNLNKYKEIEHDETSLKKLTGLRKTEFEILHNGFEKTWFGYFSKYTLDGKERLRQASIRKNSIFSDTTDALLFGLIYINNKTLQQELAQAFGIDQPKASRYLHLIHQLLSEVVIENRSSKLPVRKREWLLGQLSKME
jgi:hypothetical protein